MLVACKVKLFPNNGNGPLVADAYVNATHVGYIGPLDDDSYNALEDRPLACEVRVDGHPSQLLFSSKEEYDEFVEQVNQICSCFIPRL